MNMKDNLITLMGTIVVAGVALAISDKSTKLVDGKIDEWDEVVYPKEEEKKHWWNRK